MHGQNFIAGELSAQGKTTLLASKPGTGEVLPGSFTEASAAELDRACRAAAAAFPVTRALSGKDKAAYLRAIADEILALGDTLIQRACAESALPEARITGERGRTIGQLKLFADLVEEGSWVDARIDPAMPERLPLPRPDIRSMKRALGPVAVFGASNFPLAFSTAGGDTASAFAAGCPVVVKAHPFHPGTAELVAQAIDAAVKKCGLPAGTFSMLHGAGAGVGQALVVHPAIKAVGFTGSLGAGRAIYLACAQRPEPIPVFAELGANNPQFILPGALATRSAALAAGLAGSITMGAGQFCTNPGMTVLVDDAAGRAFAAQLGEELAKLAPGTAVACPIASSYEKGLAAKLAAGEVELIAKSKVAPVRAESAMIPALIATSAKNYLAKPELAHEVFGPVSLIVWVKSTADFVAFASQLEGQLTAAVHGEATELADAAKLLAVLEEKAGRVIVNQFPTGVEVCHAIFHGGPFPASTAASTTSVGSGAIERFTRPVCYQNLPQSLLPAELRDDNPLGLMRLVNGQRTR